jgi:predicted GIY-YIG superfamily endonuclease
MKPRYRSMLRAMEARENRARARRTGSPIWYLYILRCGDGSFYTGVTTDIARRLDEHQEGRASRFTRTRRPVVLVHQEKCGSRSQALSRECVVKSMSRQRKESLIVAGPRSGGTKRSNRPGSGKADSGTAKRRPGSSA